MPNSIGIIFLGCFSSSLSIVRVTSGTGVWNRDLAGADREPSPLEALVAGGVGAMRGEGTHTFGPFSST